MKKQCSCTQWQRLLMKLWSEEALSPEEQAALKFHLAGCPVCADVAQRYQAMIASLRARSAVTPLPKYLAQHIRFKEDSISQKGIKPIYELGWFCDQIKYSVTFSSSSEIEAVDNQNGAIMPSYSGSEGKIISKQPSKRKALTLVATWYLLFLLVGGSVLVTQMLGSFISYPSQQAQSLPIYKDFSSGVTAPNMSQRQGAKWTTNSSCQFLADGFHVIDLYEKGLQSCMANNLILSDVDLSVDVKMNHAAYVTFYLRSKTATDHPIKGYYIRINRSGKYSIQYNVSDAFGHNELIVPWTIPDARSLKPSEGIWNTIRIRLQGSQISLWFNPVSSTSQPDFTGRVPSLPDNKGIIGFGATTSAVPEDQKPPLDVVFRNLTIYDLSKP